VSPQPDPCGFELIGFVGELRGDLEDFGFHSICGAPLGVSVISDRYAYTVEGPKAFLLQIEFVDYEIGDSPFAFGSIE
jgi:hypothetical protein